MPGAQAARLPAVRAQQERRHASLKFNLICIERDCPRLRQASTRGMLAACAPGEPALPADAKEQRATAKFIFSSSARSSLKFSNNLPAFCGKVSRNCVVLLTKIA